MTTPAEVLAEVVRERVPHRDSRCDNECRCLQRDVLALVAVQVEALSAASLLAEGEVGVEWGVVPHCGPGPCATYEIRADAERHVAHLRDRSVAASLVSRTVHYGEWRGEA